MLMENDFTHLEEDKDLRQDMLHCLFYYIIYITFSDGLKVYNDS